MPLPADLRPQIDGLTVAIDKLLDSKQPQHVGDQILAVVATAIVLQCEQLQRLAHTLHRIDGTLDAILKELRNAPRTRSGGYSSLFDDGRH